MILRDIAPLFRVCIGVLVGVLLLRVVLSYKQKLKKTKQDNPPIFLSPTLQWMNCAGSILLAANQGSVRYMSGFAYPGSEWRHQESMKNSLLKWWSITDHDSAIQTMRWLVNTGMRAKYDWEMENMLEYLDYESDQALVRSIKKKMEILLKAYQKQGENALLGWDMGRVAYISQWCYLAGYLSMEEMLDVSVDAGVKAQSVFHNWHEMMESYLLGFQYWSNEDVRDHKSEAYQRKRLYEQLVAGQTLYNDKPYEDIDFYTPLSKEVVTDCHGVMPEYQEMCQKWIDEENQIRAQEMAEKQNS